MKNSIKTLLVVGAAAVISHAADSFGGVGVSFFSDREGARVLDVIPGTPAAETGLQKGDVIVSIDGVSTKGVDSKVVKVKLRGQKNQPVAIAYVRDGETYYTEIRRVQITVKDVEMNAAAMKAANGVVAEGVSAENDKKLVAVLQNGQLVNGAMEKAKGKLEGVFVDNPAEKTFAPGAKGAKPASAYVKSLDRKNVTVDVTSAGNLEISIVNADGSSVAAISVENASVGSNDVAWNSQNVPSGRYMVVVKHNGSVSGKYVILK